MEMKNLLRKTGLDGVKVVFLVNENQIKDAIILEDINSILRSGDISNLFDSDEKLSIIEKVKKILIYSKNKLI
jgi:dynein heavy chain 1, cytosolic